MASHATRHFVLQRATAIIQIPLVIWLAFSIVQHAGDSHAEIMAWLSSLVPAVLISVFILSITFHMHLGMNEVIDDYIHKKPSRSLFSRLNMLFALIVASIGIFSMIAIMFIA